MTPAVDVTSTIRIALASILVATGVPALAKAGPSASRAVAVPSCNWDRPGHEPFMGDVVKAVDFYRDIPPDVRARLQARMAKRDYDDLVSIRRDSITGKAKYGSTIRDMHFGDQRVCHSVTRDTWTPSMQERGLVYCESGQCILVPTVCRNVSRITRAEVSPDHAEGPGGIGGAGPDENGPTALAMDTGPSFVGPGGGRGPLDAGGAVGAGTETLVPPAQTGSPGGLSETSVSLSGTDSSEGSPIPGNAFAPGGAITPFLLPPGPAVAPGVSSTPPDVPPPADKGGDVPPPVVGAPVPEPETWALLLAGLATLALLSRRSKRR